MGRGDRAKASRLVGRTSELGKLSDLLHETSSGQMRIALIEGEAGIGKTALLTEALKGAEARGFRTFLGRAEEIDAERPFAAIAHALDCLDGTDDPERKEIAALLQHDPLDASAPGGLRYQIFDALVGLLEGWAIEGPVTFAIEDLHWADPSTLLAIRTLSRRLTSLPVAVLATFRPSPRVTDLERLIHDLAREGALHLLVRQLDEADVAALVEDVLGAAPGPILKEQVVGAGGNPLFVMELVTTLNREGALEVGSDTAEMRQLSLPPSLRLTILRGLSYLPASSLDVLRPAAFLGASFGIADLAAVTGRSASELLSVLDEPLRAGVLQEDEDGLRFRHDLIREAIYADVPSGVRKALHLEAARALAAAGAPALRIARHFELGASKGDDEAIRWLRDAARETAATQPSTGIELLRRALELSPSDDAETYVVQAELTNLLAYSGQPDEAEELARVVLASPQAAPLEPAMRSALVQALFSKGRWSDVVAQVEAARNSPAISDPIRGRLLAEGALARIWSGALEAAEADAKEAIRLGREARDPVAVCYGLGHLSVVADQRGEFHRGVELAQESVAVALDGRTSEAERRHPHIAYGMALVAADRLAEGKEALQEGRRLGERVGTVWDLPLYHTMLALPMFYLGEWDDAIAEAETGLALADEIGSGVGRVTAQSILATIAIHRDDLGYARRAISNAILVVEQSGPQWGMLWLALGRARLAAAEGDQQEALDLLMQAWEGGPGGPSIEDRLRLGPDLVRIAVAAGPSGLAESIADEMRSAAASARVPYADGGHLVTRGLATAEADVLVQAVEAYRPSNRVPEIAAACEDAGHALAGAGRTEEAKAHFEEALEKFESLGAPGLCARVTSRMRSFGMRRGARESRGRPATGWEALTKTELRIIPHVTSGMTNPQIAERLFVSPRTVQTHLSHIFEKLGLSSRVELAAEASRRVREDS